MNIRYNLQSVVMRGTQSGGVAMSSHQSHTHVHMYEPLVCTDTYGN